VDGLQLGVRVDAELVGQPAAERRVGVEGVGGAAGGGQGADEHRDQRLVQRLLPGQVRDLAGHHGRVTGPQLGVGPPPPRPAAAPPRPYDPGRTNRDASEAGPTGAYRTDGRVNPCGQTWCYLTEPASTPWTK
jgi:hypothetical protein